MVNPSQSKNFQSRATIGIRKVTEVEKTGSEIGVSLLKRIDLYLPEVDIYLFSQRDTPLGMTGSRSVDNTSFNIENNLNSLPELILTSS